MSQRARRTEAVKQPPGKWDADQTMRPTSKAYSSGNVASLPVRAVPAASSTGAPGRNAAPPSWTADDPPPVSLVTGAPAEELGGSTRYCKTNIPAEVLSPTPTRRRGLPRATPDESGVIRVTRVALKRGLSAVTPRPVMLVQVAGTPSELHLTRLGVPVLSVRFSIPAITRMRVTRPQLIVVGETVSRDLIPLLRTQARAIGADVLELHQFVPAAAVGPWVKDTLSRIANRQRAASLRAALPSLVGT